MIHQLQIFFDRLVKWEKVILWLFLLIALSQLWLTRYVPSLDGPQHLYNATVLANLLKGNGLFQTFFTLNDTITGYWTAHALLGLLTSFLPPWLAEKLFLSAYLMGFVFAFRYLVFGIYSKKGNFITLLIIPFAYHTFFLMGYYAFTLGAVIFFLSFGYYVRVERSFGGRQAVLFGLLLLLLFLTHGLIFLFFGVSFVLYFLTTNLYRFLVDRGRWSWKGFLAQASLLLASAVPAVLLWGIYIRKVMELDSTVSGTSHTFWELMLYLFRIRQLVGFHHELEAVGYIPLFVLLVLLSAWVVYSALWGRKGGTHHIRGLLSPTHVWAIIGLLFLALYFFAPERVSAGSLTHRFGLYFFFMLLVWLSVQKIPKLLQLLTLFILFFSMVYTRATHLRFYSKLNKDIAEITYVGDFMEPNSVVDYRLSSKNWVHLHFQLYAAVNRPQVHLRNVQCWGQFPMVWNYESLPRCYAGDKLVRPSGARSVGEEMPRMEVDYFTVFYMDRFAADTTEREWQQILESHYELVATSPKGSVGLYARKGEIESE